MNKDQVKGRAKEAAGEVQEQFGKLVGSKKQEAKGHAREQAGKVQKTVGDTREAIEDAADDVKDAYKKP
ncbi:CsbD family protein [uncultured Ramlibacter sp.]|mgnify:CR=1 FL=1|uniref:CsbD family protein n=1 Tax=uncultured Ramlibacter sp. TaxID=260755 RepID=UPI00261289EF|nr:CsbD family protein [uncultured Ramlibacter sp.]